MMRSGAFQLDHHAIIGVLRPLWLTKDSRGMEPPVHGFVRFLKTVQMRNNYSKLELTYNETLSMSVD
jgi:hypothetical protein